MLDLRFPQPTKDADKARQELAGILPCLRWPLGENSVGREVGKFILGSGALENCGMAMGGGGAYRQLLLFYGSLSKAEIHLEIATPAANAGPLVWRGCLHLMPCGVMAAFGAKYAPSSERSSNRRVWKFARFLPVTFTTALQAIFFLLRDLGCLCYLWRPLVLVRP